MARRGAASTATRRQECAWLRSTRPWPAWCWRTRGVRSKEEQAETEEARDQAKQEAELSVAPRLVRQAQALLRGRLVRGEARYCQKALCHHISATGGEYLVAVKAHQAHQPDLLEEVPLLFREPPPGDHLLTARQVDQQGGRLAVRQWRASAPLASSLRAAGWEAAGLVLEGETHVRWPAHPTRPVRQQVRFFLTSRPAHPSAAEAVQATRRQWHIENRLQWPRDVTLGEEACQVRSGHAPQALAAVRNLVVALLRSHGVSNLAAALRTNAWAGPATVLGFLGLHL
jgi:Transposase DDE domain